MLTWGSCTVSRRLRRYWDICGSHGRKEGKRSWFFHGVTRGWFLLLDILVSFVPPVQRVRWRSDGLCFVNTIIVVDLHENFFNRQLSALKRNGGWNPGRPKLVFGWLIGWWRLSRGTTTWWRDVAVIFIARHGCVCGGENASGKFHFKCFIYFS